MKLDYYVNDVKWKEIETRNEFVNRKFIPFEIYQEEEGRYYNTFRDDFLSGSVKVKLIHFEVIEHSESVINQYLSRRVYDELRYRSMSSKRILYNGELFHNIYFQEGYVIFSKLQAFCNDSDVFIENSGELSWADTKVKEIKMNFPTIIKVKKTIFDFIDLT